MKCMDPILCYRTNSGTTYRHFSLANRLFKNLHNIVFNCGTCLICRKRRATELAIRCVLHSSLSPDNAFLTLTYDESKTDYHNNFQYKDIQDFKKRLRRHCEYHHDKKIQIFNVHEYGKNGKKHWHLVLFNHQFKDKILYTKKNGNYLYTSKQLLKLWPYGHHTIGDVTEASAMYQAQYTQKDLKNGNTQNEKKAHSKHSGIGKPYFLKHYQQILKLGYIPFNGKKIPIPRYFQKIAHKHYSHFYETDNFFDLPHRKKLYSPFSSEIPNKDLADHYINYKESKNLYIEQLETEWENIMFDHLNKNEDPDFIKSAKNYIYDLNNKQNNKEF